MFAWLGSLGFKALLNWALAKFLAFMSLLKKDKENHQNQVDQAAKDSHAAEVLTPDSTEKETEDAIDAELSHL